MVIVVSLLGALLLFLFQSHLYRRYWRHSLETRLSFSEEMLESGERATILEETENRKRLPLPYYEYSYTMQKSFSVFRLGKNAWERKVRLGMKGRTLLTKQTETPPLTRGIYTLGDGRMASSDLFFTENLSSPLFPDSVLVVLPKKVETEDVAVPFRHMLGQVLSSHISEEDPFEVRNIRPYEIYDSQKSINWKASAKTGELKVNTYAYTTSERVSVLLDLREGTEEERETLISLASTLSSLFLRRGVTVSLYTNGRSCFLGRKVEVLPGTGNAHALTIDKALSEIKVFSVTEEDAEDLLFSSSGVPVLVSRSLSSSLGAPKEGRGYAFLLEESTSSSWECFLYGGSHEE
ncbi:MAG: DUF58 domain-containing protein [Spirochaetales bacterium]|nr:DUF58 domain-containing protein [Candidatus Physcosoma equi]